MARSGPTCGWSSGGSSFFKTVFPQIAFSYRGSGGFDREAGVGTWMPGSAGRRVRAIFAAIYMTW